VSVQERKLPEQDNELVLMWEVCGRNYAETARQYDANESSVRKRIQRALENAAELRPYRLLPIPTEQLYQEWLQLGARYGDAVRLADKYDVKADTVRSALRRYRERNSRNG